MARIPKDIPNFGSATQRVRQNPEFDPTKLTAFTNEDYYVWSRIDGNASLYELILMIGFDTEKTIGILSRLREFGALLMPNATSTSVNTVAEGGDATPTTQAAQEQELDTATLTDVEREALAEDVMLSDQQKRRVLWMLRQLRKVDHFELFGLGADADKKQIKRSYFRLSKEFHPDRFYGKALGSFGPWLATVFEHLTDAFEVLSHAKKRAAYAAVLRGETPATQRGEEQSKQEYALELFERACGAETSGDLASAVQVFSAVVRMDPQPRYLRRAATCAVAAGELRSAEEYAKQATDLQRQDPSYARVLADVYRASGNWREAEKTLLRALELKTENDILTSELQADLAEVRRIQGL